VIVLLAEKETEVATHRVRFRVNFTDGLGPVVKKEVLPLLGIESLFFDYPVRSVVSIQTEQRGI